MQKITARDLDVDYYADYISSADADELFNLLRSHFGLEKRRKSMLIGDEHIQYTINYRGTTKTTVPKLWDEFPALKELKEKIEQTIQQKLTVCVVQFYPSGKVGILPHRDKEMVQGTKICGLSLGQARQIVFGRDGYAPHKLLLENGSLYVMNDRRVKPFAALPEDPFLVKVRPTKSGYIRLLLTNPSRPELA